MRRKPSILITPQETGVGGTKEEGFPKLDSLYPSGYKLCKKTESLNMCSESNSMLAG